MYGNYYYYQQQEMLKIKYRNLRNNINAINAKLSDLNASYDTLHSSIKNNLKINNKMPNEDIFVNIHNDINSVKNEVSGRLLHFINSKC